MEKYFDGNKLYGNDFSTDKIKQWYEEESEAFADLGIKHFHSYSYEYHTMNQVHGFNKIKKSTFKNVLGIGSAWGFEFKPIIDKIIKLTIIESSNNLISKKIGNLIPNYIKPNFNGSISIDENSFDLITCFGVLHHIPNVEYVLDELIRVLKHDGYLILKEPIVSMGDWPIPRKNLKKNERGIPVSFFDSIFEKHSVEIISKEYCNTNTSYLEHKIGHLLSKPIYSYKFYVMFDKYVSCLLKNYVRYYTTKKIFRIGPKAIYYVIKK